MYKFSKTKMISTNETVMKENGNSCVVSITSNNDIEDTIKNIKRANKHVCVISYLYGFTNSKLRQSIVPVKKYV